MPATSMWPENTVNQWTPPQVIASAVPIISIAEEERAIPVGPIPADVPIIRAGSSSLPTVLPRSEVRTTDNRYEPPRPPEKEKKLRVPHWMIAGFMLATYAGGTIRNLWRSLPKQCQSRMSRTGRSGRKNIRRYDSMLGDIARCIDRVDFGKFGL